MRRRSRCWRSCPDSNVYRRACSALSVCSRHQSNRETVEDEHEEKVNVSLAACALEFFPDKNSPKGCHHRRGLANGVRNRDSRKAGRNQIEDHARAPDHAAQQTKNMTGGRSAEEIGK